MPRLIAPSEGDAIGLDELVDALDAAPWDPRDEDALASFGPWLARLARNRRFLADLAIDELSRADPMTATGGYGAQAMVLRPPNGRYLLRAAFWPALGDAVTRASGTAPFFYGHAHDHNFSFLTVGYLGPGYWSDYYERDGDPVGLPGEPVALRFVERARLEPGRVLLYRAHRDVHVQHPPDAFSVSLNILAYDFGQPWRTQYRYDIAARTIAEPLTTTPSEALVAAAVHGGGEAGRALAEELLAGHPSPRMRATALAALASALPDREARAALFERAAGDADPLLAGLARHRLAQAQLTPERSQPDASPADTSLGGNP